MIPALVLGVVVAATTVIVIRGRARRRAGEILAAARVEAKALSGGARLEAQALRRAAQTAAREEALEVRGRADDEVTAAVEDLARREERLSAREAELAAELGELDARDAELGARHGAMKSLRDRARGLRGDAQALVAEARAALEARAGETGDEMIQAIGARWLEDVRAAAKNRLRNIDASGADAAADTEALRLMTIASSRYQNHFLTEKSRSNIKVGDGVCDLLVADGHAVLDALAKIANVNLHPSDEGDAVRLEGLDGVGREVARRALNKLTRKPAQVEACKADPEAWAQKIRDNLEREIRALGKKAFSVLHIEKAHPEIVELVGALNYRTSYTQNQWLHAVEASFLAGMMASELGLDLKLARRATLMHDIGKALTHQIEGSHAVIGADIARRLGEDEIVANAIGSHHADEPPNSVYAYLVAAADAMSGARPGARREMTEGFSTKVEDLERIGASYRGVERAHAVHGGRELRVYVQENAVSDLDTVELSSEIAAQIAEEMTFPGQIKVTVIRAYEAVSTAS